MPDYINKNQNPGDDNAEQLYFRRFTAEDYHAVRRAIDAEIERKPRKKRSDSGKPKTEGV